MAFDFGAGLSQAGTAVAATAGAYTLEQQKAELETQKIQLADQLAGAREEKGRQFTTSERVATQGFTAGENTANRENALKLANINADAVVKSAGIHAGGTIAAATIGATAHSGDVRAQITAAADLEEKRLAQNKPLIDAEVLQKGVATVAAKAVNDAKDELAAARATGDPVKLKEAQQKVFDAEYSSQAQVQQVSVLQTQAKLAEQNLTNAQTRLQQAMDPTKGMAMTPEGKALIATLEAQYRKAHADYQTAFATASEAAKNLPNYSPPSGATGPDLNKYMKTPPAPGGLINATPPNP